MIAMLLAAVLNQALPAVNDARVSVYLTAPMRDGFADTTKDIQDSIADIAKNLVKKKDVRLADSPDDADVTLIVVGRGVGVDAYGSRTTARDTRYAGVVVEDTPMVANTFWVSTVLQAGTYRKEFVGRHTQKSAASLGAWSTVADDLAKQVDAWTTTNAAQIRSRRAKRQR
jgi:hypothetical protein